MTICIPPDTDWGCAYPPDELAAMRADPGKLAVMERSEAFAWQTLAALTAYRIGTCPIVVRPCAQRCAPQGTWMDAVVATGTTIPVATIGRSFTPHIEGGEWVNSCGCAAADPCSCGPLSEIILPGPVGAIVEIVIDGVILDPLAYRVDNGNRLVRQDGGSWPICQDMSKAAVAPRAFVPVELTWPTGERVELSREGDVVTAVVHTRQTNTRMAVADAAIPADFQPRGADISLSLRADARNPDWWLNVTEDEFSSDTYIGPLGGFGTVGPYSPSVATFQWLADPAPVVGQDGTFTVEYYRGAAPNEITRFAAGTLAAEFYKGCMNANTKCRLPRGTTSVNRNGLSIELEPNFMDSLASWPEIAPVIAMFNPNRLKSAPRVLSPDSRSTPRRQTWGAW